MIVIYTKTVFEDSVRVPPKFLGEDVKEAVKKSLEDKYENAIIRDVGVVLAITDVGDIAGGSIQVEDPGVHYNATFEALVYTPKLHEVVTGSVADITNFGVFVRIGPLDGLCHVSQVINDFVSFDPKTGLLAARDSKKTLKAGDTVKARVIAVSLDKKEINKINLTMRQPGLGKMDWIQDEKDKKSGKKPAKK